MHRYILILVIVLGDFSSYSQIVKLETNNPFPRIGDECEISYQILTDTFSVSDDLDFIQQSKQHNAKKLGNGSIILGKVISDTGNNIIGPFTFSFNNKELKSNTINLFFDKPLPNVNQGIWIRQANYLNQDYLIIEQRISGEWKTTKTSRNSTSTIFVEDSKDFVEIDKESIDKAIVKILDNYSQSKSQEVVINDNSVTVSYKLTVYIIEKAKEFPENGLELKHLNFKYLPKNQKHLKFKIE